MEALIRLNNQTAGRDKLARLVQYLSRALGALLEGRPRAAHKFQGLEYALSTFRKLLRWGRCVEAAHAALQALSHPDAAHRTALALARVAHALFLFADHLLWLGRAGLAKIDAKKWTSIANRYWLYSVSLNLVRDAMELRTVKEKKGSVLNERALLVDTVKNTCDLFIPLTALSYTRLGPGAVGLLGMASSLAGLLTILQPQLKL